MSAYTLTRADEVDPEHFKEFQDRVNFVIPLLKQRYAGIVMGIGEANWSSYLNGHKKVTYDIIRKFDLVFQYVLKGKYQGNTGGVYPVNDEDPLKEISEKLSGLSADIRKIIAGQNDLTKKINALKKKS
jgi:hypothetical protein